MKPFFAALLLTFVASAACAADATLQVADLTFKFGDPWKEVESASPMRAGTLQYPIEGAEKPAEAVFYYFGAGQGGDVEANVARWLGQFEGTPESKREEIAAGDKKVTLVQASGTYMDGAPFGPKTPRENYTLLGAIVPAGDSNVFIKLAGPKEGVQKLLEDFKKLATSPFGK